MGHSRNASVRRLDHPPVVCSPAFDPVQLMIRGDLKEIDVYHTHSFICLIVSFPSGQHISFVSYFGSRMPVAKTPPLFLLAVLGFRGYLFDFKFEWLSVPYSLRPTN